MENVRRTRTTESSQEQSMGHLLVESEQPSGEHFVESLSHLSGLRLLLEPNLTIM